MQEQDTRGEESPEESPEERARLEERARGRIEYQVLDEDDGGYDE